MNHVLRVRFHGRGGQGMKTAGRILGTAAFRAGFVVQDAPVYGAERRGAPMAAFVRIAREPILERGAILDPDLVLIADETLLDDPAALPLGGAGAGTTIVVNSARVDVPASHGGPSFAADFTALALERLGSVAGLSTALGAAAARLAGLPLEAALAGVAEEVGAFRLDEGARAANEDLARAAWARVEGWPAALARGTRPSRAVRLAEVSFEPARRAAPSIYATGNSPLRRTGTWRQVRPVLEPEKCNACWICFVRCPEGAIGLDEREFPVVDYDVCKGCLLCAHECPTHAFRVERETR